MLRSVSAVFFRDFAEDVLEVINGYFQSTKVELRKIAWIQSHTCYVLSNWNITMDKSIGKACRDTFPKWNIEIKCSTTLSSSEIYLSSPLRLFVYRRAPFLFILILLRRHVPPFFKNGIYATHNVRAPARLCEIRIQIFVFL